MANVQVEAVKEKKSWVHCWLCGADDREAADWLISTMEYSDKYKPKKIVIPVCDDCLKALGTAVAEMQNE